MPHRSPRPRSAAAGSPTRPLSVLSVVSVLSILVSTSTCTTSTAADQTWAGSILFVGNSLTYVNDLPADDPPGGRAGGRFAARRDGGRAGSRGHRPHQRRHRRRRADRARALGRVVLQQGPTPEGMCRDTLIIAAMRLAPQIRASGGRPALLAPWARRGFPEAVDWATESATAAARAVGGIVVPAGIAWRTALAADPTLPLYAADGYHPAPAGTLLAALTVYERVFARDVRQLPAEPLRQMGGPAAASGDHPARRRACRERRPAAGPHHACPRGHDARLDDRRAVLDL